MEENTELQAYLSELNRGLEKLEVRFKTGNTVVDTLLNMKYHEAVREPDSRRGKDEQQFRPADAVIFFMEIPHDPFQ